ncbi:MAG: hypothetical protein F4W91_03000 [Gemmatimonadetes bacterium]|nr:hypothetical protein [Gemmatimonadota bacterium]
MNEHATNPRIIIDASYILGTSSDGTPFRTMCEQGGRIVLIDTLIYELCSNRDTNQWRASMNKLKAGVDAIEVWEHISPMYEVELKENRPYGDPLHDEKTKRMWKMTANNSQYQPADMEKLMKSYVEEREGDDIVTLFQKFANWQLQAAKAIKGKAGDGKEVVQFCYNVVNTPSVIRSPAIDVLKQTAKEEGLDVLLNPEDVDETWAIWHFGKSLLVLLCDSQRRGEDTVKEITEKLRNRLINTKHDLDYLVSLAFADAIASCETTGAMSYYRKWMFGDAKPQLCSYEPDQITRFMDKLK